VTLRDDDEYGLFQIPTDEVSFPGGFGEDVTPLETNRGKPIIVVERDDDYRLIDGWGRMSGLLNADAEWVQAIVVSPREAAERGAGSEEWNEDMYDKYAPQFRYPGTTN
jgi:hypothetical protein